MLRLLGLEPSSSTMLSGTTTVNFVFAFVSSVFVMGTGTVNTTDTIGFVEEDNQRDTISLLISCFATLGLCVYSAVHLNVPRKAEGSYRTLLREFQWCVLGLFAPELILYTAWRQLASARQLRYEIEQVSREESVGTGWNEKLNPAILLQEQH
ncbi:hypothetical protein A1F94_007661 [Pyrenophora tritici-repentis]|uniref:Uncharacterized protein n=1 Tax=Pyrenophora tritici-repentis TaxID=45151 RepID=A0A834RPS4_9PLEO|nr:hypothetical protein A1F99_096020 [Pyrenophora tritici-repentis]KAF7567420.1 hypothetical protein PtrM4_140110 [Pyrenophora tritici-repentis]KAG9382007.1 hypothetical protein A1F94_007661 [Pyrenophora tritici-repentis]